MACVAFLRPFMESMVSGGMATTVQSMNNSYAKGSKLSSLFSTRSDRRASKPNPTYKMENLSEVGLNDGEGTFGKSESNANGSQNDIPSIHNDEIHFMPTSTNINNYEDLGPLRPDKVMSFSRVSNAPLEDDEAFTAEGQDMVITRTRGWEVQEEYKQARGDDRDCKR
jgi:hypothetical protein